MSSAAPELHLQCVTECAVIYFLRGVRARRHAFAGTYGYRSRIIIASALWRGLPRSAAAVDDV